MPYACLTHTLNVLYKWLRVPTKPITTLCAPYMHLMRALPAADACLMRALCAPYTRLMHTLCTIYEWLRVPATANHSLTCTLCTPYTCLMHALCMPYVCLTCTLHALYEWLRVPATATHSLTCTLRAPYMCFTCLASL